MNTHHQATKYFIKFHQLATCVRWGNAALHQQAYNGLAKHFKNDMVHHGKPNTLVGLCGLAQSIDACYWECKSDIAQETGNPGPSGMKPNSKPNPKPTPVLETPHCSPRITLAQCRTKEVLLNRRNPPQTHH